MKTNVGRKLAARKRRILARLDKRRHDGCEGPVLRPVNIQYELADRARGMSHGGIGSMLLLARRLKLAEAIDERLHLLKLHLPYHESDHVLNFAFNALCDGTCLDDIELRRNDEVYLDAIGARRVPDPTTAGDFCRRFQAHHVRALLDVFNAARLQVWAEQPDAFFDEARIDMDGTMVTTDGACKEGIDINYKGQWGYHPLVVSLANTGEVLSIVNRSGNRPSHEGAAEEVDRVLALCRQAGFRRVRLRGDTDFTQTEHLDRWTDDERVTFVFGADATPARWLLAENLPENAWKPLTRPPRYEVRTKPRARPQNVKEAVVERREFDNICLVREEVAEFDYRPAACRKTYRMVVVKKYLEVRKGQQVLFHDYRYFFYLTNDRESSASQIVYSANDRCDQENLHAQLKGGVRSLSAPVDGLVSNWAYMVMTSLAWNLKAWWALMLPEPKGNGRRSERQREEKRRVLRMEFKTFLNALMRLPCQIVKGGRQLAYRLWGWNPWLGVFFRLVDRLKC
ncbi:MAG: IS1380 family transposase [Xanthobacteraceae bacterium]